MGIDRACGFEHGDLLQLAVRDADIPDVFHVGAGSRAELRLNDLVGGRVDAGRRHIRRVAVIIMKGSEEVRVPLLRPDAWVAETDFEGHQRGSLDGAVEVCRQRDEVVDYGTRARPVLERPLGREVSLRPGDDGYGPPAYSRDVADRIGDVFGVPVRGIVHPSWDIEPYWVTKRAVLEQLREVGSICFAAVAAGSWDEDNGSFPIRPVFELLRDVDDRT